jgi:type IV fimbrial biogenesis protein FimT
MTRVPRALAPQQGFTMVEILITIAVMSILIAIGLPNFSIWIQNTQTRTAAESILNGLQLARGEAVRRNVTVKFVMGSQSDWAVSVVSTGEVVQDRPAKEGSPNANVQARTGSTVAPSCATTTTVTFNALGRVLDNNGDATKPIAQVDVTNTALTAADARNMRIVISSGGGVRMCDPKVAVGDPRACPANPAPCA